MKKLWTYREIDAPATVLWSLLTDLDRWPEWGPSITSASIDGDTMGLGATGVVRTIAGVDLKFTISEFDDGRSWAWKVAGIPATHHCVQSLSPQRCRVGFGAPWIAAPYLAVCDMALRRLDTMATSDTRASR